LLGLAPVFACEAISLVPGESPGHRSKAQSRPLGLVLSGKAAWLLPPGGGR
jgi:hypothetical protein